MTLSGPRQAWLALALGSAALALVSIGLTEWRDLAACHLCVFQRLLFMVLAAAAAGAAIAGPRLLGRLLGALAVPTAAAGLGTAVYQSWIQRHATDTLIVCSGAEPNLIERWVDWLGERMPALFLATGFCNEAGATFFGLTLANWASVAFAAALAGAVWALWRDTAGDRAPRSP